jgi:GcrA cell cycle regulator
MNVRRHSLISALSVYLSCKNVKRALSVVAVSVRSPHMVNVATRLALERAAMSLARQNVTILSGLVLLYKIKLMWDAAGVVLLKKLWASGHSAGQIASRLGLSRNAVCAKLLRLGLKRGHKPPTAKPRIVSVPKRKPALLAACAQPVHKVRSTRKPVAKPPKEFTKSQLKAMLAEAIANTARLPRRQGHR